MTTPSELLRQGVMCKSVTDVEAALDKGAQINEMTNHLTPLLLASQVQGNSEVLKLLLEKGADVNAQSVSSQNSLHQVAYHRDLEMGEVLLGYGVDFEAENNFGKTAMDIANSTNFTELVEQFRHTLIKGDAPE